MINHDPMMRCLVARPQMKTITCGGGPGAGVPQSRCRRKRTSQKQHREMRRSSVRKDGSVRMKLIVSAVQLPGVPTSSSIHSWNEALQMKKWKDKQLRVQEKESFLVARRRKRSADMIWNTNIWDTSYLLTFMRTRPHLSATNRN